MPKPARSFKKPKPEAIFCRSKLSATLAISQPTPATTRASVKSCNRASRRLTRKDNLEILIPYMLTNGRRILQPAIFPKCINATGDTQRRVLANIALESLGIITDCADDVIGPVIANAHIGAKRTIKAQKTLHRWIALAFHCLNIA